LKNPEEKAREEIDAQLIASGWIVQTKNEINLFAGRGVAVCELKFDTGKPDYTLFVDSKAIGTIEAKPEGITLTSVEVQSDKYVTGVPFGLPAWKSPLSFCYESTGAETFFTNRLDPFPRSRRVFSFHRPETLLAWVQQVIEGGKPLAQRLREFPPLAVGNLWRAQFEAIKNLENLICRWSSACTHSDGYRLWQNLHCGEFHLSTRKVRRGEASTIPGGPRQPWRPDAQGIPAVRLARKQLQVHGGIYSPATEQQHARQFRPRRHRDNPAHLLHAEG